MFIWLFIVKACITGVIGSAFYAWFKTTKMGIWFDKKLDRCMNWATQRLDIEVLKKIAEHGGQIIFCTARPENQRKKLEKSLRDQGLQWYQIVMGCLHSQRVLINDYAASNPYPSSIAVSIQRDLDNLRSYLIDL